MKAKIVGPNATVDKGRVHGAVRLECAVLKNPDGLIQAMGVMGRSGVKPSTSVV